MGSWQFRSEKLEKQRKTLAEERRVIKSLIGKLDKSNEYVIKSGKYRNKNYLELQERAKQLDKQIDDIEGELLYSENKRKRLAYKPSAQRPFSASDLATQATKLKKTPKRTKKKSRPAIAESLYKKVSTMRKDTAPDSENEEEWELQGSGFNSNNIETLIHKLDLICGSLSSGNTSSQVKKQGISILDTLLKLRRISKTMYGNIYKNYFI